MTPCSLSKCTTFDQGTCWNTVPFGTHSLNLQSNYVHRVCLVGDGHVVFFCLSSHPPPNRINCITRLMKTTMMTTKTHITMWRRQNPPPSKNTNAS